MDIKEIKNNIAELITVNQQRRNKYYRNLSLYEGTPRIALENIRNPSVIGYYSEIDEINEDTVPTPNLNVIKSCIDTLHSKIAQSKVRPFFNCVNGSFKDIQIVKQAQQFFDLYFDIEEVNKKIPDAFKDGCIFECGYIYIDADEKRITRALPYQVYERPAEFTYDKVSRTYYERRDYPVELLPDFLKAKIENKNVKYVKYGLYFDTKNKVKCYCLPDYEVYETATYDCDVTPFVRIFYNSPVASLSSCSVVDILVNIQLQINALMNKIKDASQLNAAMTYFIPRGSGIKTGQLNNRVGNIVEYDVTSSMTGSPVTVATPSFIDPEYLQLLQDLINKAYELTGVSMLSAQSKKPVGLDSGIALATMEDVESERFETQLNQVIRGYVNVAKVCMKVFPKEEFILPESINRMSIKWADIVEESKKMQIQFSSASSLSNNAINAVLSVISDCIENDVFDVPEYIPLQLLEDEILNTQLSLRAANYALNKESIAKLSRLYEICLEKEKEMEADSENSMQAMDIGNVINNELMNGQAEDIATAVQEEGA